jgi:hypothetical protein
MKPRTCQEKRPVSSQKKVYFWRCLQKIYTINAQSADTSVLLEVPLTQLTL